MKVLFVTQTAAIRGGVERWLSNLCTGLAAKGIEVVLALADGPAFHKADRYLEAFPELAALPHVILRSSGLPRGRHRALEEAIKTFQPDVVVPVLVHETLGAVAARKDTGQRLKLVYPIHESEAWAFDGVARNIALIDAIVAVNRLMLDALVCLSPWPSSRSFHIRAGVDHARTPSRPRTSRSHVVVGYCGKLVNDPKRVSDLIVFCHQLDSHPCPYTLLVAGAGPEEDALAQALAPQIKDGRVSMLGELSKEALYTHFYPKLDALLITSVWETGPLVAWEAMIHGVLVVSSAYRGLAREGLLRHKETALIYPVGQPAQAAIALTSVCEDMPSFRRIALEGKAIADQALSITRMVDDWSSMLEQVMSMDALPAAKRPYYDLPVSFLDRLKDRGRSVLGRPVYCGSSHEEWPRYTPGLVPTFDRDRFTHKLDELELSLCCKADSAHDRLATTDRSLLD